MRIPLTGGGRRSAFSKGTGCIRLSSTALRASFQSRSVQPPPGCPGCRAVRYVSSAQDADRAPARLPTVGRGVLAQSHCLGAMAKRQAGGFKSKQSGERLGHFEWANIGLGHVGRVQVADAYVCSLGSVSTCHVASSSKGACERSAWPCWALRAAARPRRWRSCATCRAPSRRKSTASARRESGEQIRGRLKALNVSRKSSWMAFAVQKCP